MLIAALIAASVGLPPAHPPGASLAGVRVTWPLKTAETALSPGASLTVRVSSSRRRARLALVRVSGSGRTMRTIARRTLRKGTFSARIPAAVAGAHYALRIEVAGHKRWSWVTTSVPTPAPTQAPAPAAPAPTAKATPISICGSRRDRPYSAFTAEVRLSATTVKAGETLAYTLVNTGQYEATDHAHHSLAPATATFPPGWSAGPQFLPLPPGASTPYQAEIPADTPPGRYRIWHDLSVLATCDAVSPLLAQSEPFDVLAP